MLEAPTGRPAEPLPWTAQTAEMNDTRDVKELVDRARADLERAEAGDDSTRLEILESLYRALEEELDRDETDQARR
ncbi:MAG: hypothetical protein QOC87_1932 [Actinomycetota bacterium]|nr:hypothetical protein [Actinomycetota bacterium]